MSGRINYSNLSDSLKAKFNEAGLTEEQVQELIDAGLAEVWETVNECQKYKLTRDTGDGFDISNQDADTLLGSGVIYKGENITNSPNCAAGTWWTIENYITDDGLWGHQIATAWHSEEQHIRRKVNGTYQGWRKVAEVTNEINSLIAKDDEINTRLNNAQTYKLTDGNGFCQNLGSVNWNTVKRTGYYMGSNTTNAPENSTDWFMVHVIAHNDIWCEQIATAFSSTQKRYVRYQLNGTWTAWRSL
jgi:hypothetical protein